MLSNKSITIIGLGLIGGSLAKAFKKYLNAKTIYAVGRDMKNILPAIEEGVINKGFCDINNAEVINSDLIFICTPVKNATSYIQELALKVSANTIITDVCSTKEDIVNFVNTMENPPCFIGGHPMAGREKSGYMESSQDLIKGAIYVLTRTKTTDENTFLILFNIVAGIGGIPVELEPKEHDESVAIISHLPHIMAFALVDLVKEKDTKGNLKRLAAGGFKDISRVASSDENMWESIMISNKEEIIKTVTTYVDKLNGIINNIQNNDSEALKHLIINARNYRDSIPN